MADANLFLRKGFEKSEGRDAAGAMTVDGAVNKTGILLLLAFAGAVFTWNLSATGGFEAAFPFMAGGFVVGFILAIATVIKPEWSNVTAPVYAVAEGLLLGAVSAPIEAMMPGIASNTIMLTGGVLFLMLGLYKFGILAATPGFVRGVFMATAAVALVYLVDIVLGLFGVRMPMIHESGPFGIIFSLVVVGIAAMNLILDFEFIKQGAAEGLSSRMEWYGAFGLLVTLVWLYLEILRLLMKLRD